MSDHVTDAALYVSDLLVCLGFGRDARPTALSVLDAAMGLDAYSRAVLVGSETQIARVGGGWRLAVHRGLPPFRANWALALRLISWCMAQDGIAATAARTMRAPAAAALVLPADVVLPALHGLSHTELARRLVVPVTATILRHGELEGIPTMAVLRGGYARVRGDAAGLMPRDQATAEAWAFGPRRLRTIRTVVVGERETLVRRAA